MSVPLKMICPDVGVSSRVIIRPVVDLPQPDSPTRPRLSPAFRSKLDAVDGLDDLPGPAQTGGLLDREVHLQVADLQQREP